MANLNVRLIFSAVTNQVESAVNALRGNMDALQERVNRVARSMLDLGGAVRALAAGFSLLAVGSALKSLVELADNLRLVEGRVRLASDGALDFASNYARLVSLSLRLGAPLQESANVFARLNPVIKQMGGTSADTLRQVELLSKSIVLAAATQAQATAIMQQWGQAMASGRLSGDEFRTLMELNPPLMQRLATALNTTIGGLRAMAEAQELTSDRIAAAMVKIGASLDAEYARLPLTVGRALEKVKTAFGQYVADVDKGRGATEGLAGALDGLAQNIVPVLDGLVTLAKLGALVAFNALISGAAASAAGFMRQRQAAAVARAEIEAHAMNAVVDAEAIVAQTAAQVANTQANQAGLAVRQASLQTQLAEINAAIALRQSTLAVMQAQEQSAAVQAALAQETAALTALETERNAVLAQSATVGRLQTQVTAQMATAEVAAATAANGLTAAQQRLAQAQAQVNAAATAGALTFRALLNPLNLMNLAFAGMAGYTFGQWLNSFSAVRRGATVAIDAIASALSELEFQVKEFGLNWKLLFTFDDAQIAKIEQQLDKLEADFQARAKARKEVLAGSQYADDPAAPKTEVQELADSFKAAQSPIDEFKAKTEELSRDFNAGKITLEVYTKTLNALTEAYRKAKGEKMSPFEKEQAKLQAETDKALLSPRDFQRKQYELDGFTVEEIDNLMAAYDRMEAAKLAAGKTTHKEQVSLDKQRLAAALDGIKQEQESRELAHKNTVQALENEYAAKALLLKQDISDETTLSARLLALKEEESANKLDMERRFLAESVSLELRAFDAKIAAAKAAATPVSAKGGVVFNEEQLSKSFDLIRRLRQELDLTQAQAAGIVGNLFHESAGLNTKAISADGHDSFGLAQWTFARKQALFAYAAARGKNAGEFDVQVDFLINELKTTENAALEQLRKAATVPQAATTFGVAFERPKASLAHNDRRIAAAQTAFGDGGDGSGNAQLAAVLQEREAFLRQSQARLKALGLDAEADAIAHKGKLLDIERKQNDELRSAQLDRLEQEAQADLGQLAAAQQQAEQQLQLGIITQEQLLAKEREYAEKKFAIEKELFIKKMALQGLSAAEQKAALDRYLAEAEKQSAALSNNLFKTAQAAQQQTRELFAPLESAIDQSVSGIITGQQTLAQAAQNSAQSIVLSYVQAFIKKRVIQQAEWAYEAAGFAGLEAQKAALAKQSEESSVLLWAFKKAFLAKQWLFEVLGFQTKETAKVGAKVAGETAQTGAHAVGESAREGISLAAHIKSVFMSATKAAAGAYAAVMEVVPAPFNFPLAVAAGAAAFAGTMAIGVFSSEKGLLEVPEDRLQFVHKKETILPAREADNFRKITKTVLGGGGFDAAAVVNEMANSGAIARRVTLPDFAQNFAGQSQASAERLAKERSQSVREMQSSGGESGGKAVINMQGIMITPEAFIKDQEEAIAKVVNTSLRKFNKGGR